MRRNFHSVAEKEKNGSNKWAVNWNSDLKDFTSDVAGTKYTSASDGRDGGSESGRYDAG